MRLSLAGPIGSGYKDGQEVAKGDVFGVLAGHQQQRVHGHESGSDASHDVAPQRDNQDAGNGADSGQRRNHDEGYADHRGCALAASKAQKHRPVMPGDDQRRGGENDPVGGAHQPGNGHGQHPLGGVGRQNQSRAPRPQLLVGVESAHVAGPQLADVHAPPPAHQQVGGGERPQQVGSYGERLFQPAIPTVGGLITLAYSAIQSCQA